MKKIALIGSLVAMLILQGCGSKVDYTRNTNPGEVKEITYEEFKEMREKDDTFMALVSQTYCSHCIDYKSGELSSYLSNHGVTVYEINLTNEEDPKTVYDEIAEEYGSDFQGTPTTLIYEGKEVKVVQSGILDEDELEEYVTKYQLDKLEE